MKIIQFASLLGLFTVLGCGGVEGHAASVQNETTQDDAGDRAEGSPAEHPDATRAYSPPDAGATELACTPKNDATFPVLGCKDLSRLAVVAVRVVDPDGDGRFSAGEHVTLEAKLRDVSGSGFYSYPGVDVIASDERLSVEQVTFLYGVGECQEATINVEIALPAELPPGTSLHFDAFPSMLGGDCHGDSGASVDLVVGESP